MALIKVKSSYYSSKYDQSQVSRGGTHPFADRRAFVRLVDALLFRQLTAHFESAVVNRLKDALIQILRFLAVERMAHQDHGVGQSLHTDADGAVPLVWTFSLRQKW